MRSKIGAAGRWVKQVATPTSVNPKTISALRTQRFGITSVQEAEDYRERISSVVENLQTQKLMSDTLAYVLIAVALVIAVVGIGLGIWPWDVSVNWVAP